MESKEYSTIRTRLEDGVGYLQIYRLDEHNRINGDVDDLHRRHLMRLTRLTKTGHYAT